MEHAEEVFYRIFPMQVASGKNQSATSDWIYHHCEDGRGVVTPRDVIDLLEFAVKAQIDHLQRGADADLDCLIGAQGSISGTIKEEMQNLSTSRVPKFLGRYSKV